MIQALGTMVTFTVGIVLGWAGILNSDVRELRQEVPVLRTQVQGLTRQLEENRQATDRLAEVIRTHIIAVDRQDSRR